MSSDAFERAIEITRGDLVETAHSAAVAVVDAEGGLIASLGEPGQIIYLRSAAKPFQASTVLLSGVAEKLGLDERQIALISSSHSGEPVHAETAAGILALAGLDESALRCGTHAPFSRSASESLLRAGRKPGPLVNNCSGKHGGMLAAARISGEPIESYLDPDHPLQRRILESVAAFTGSPAASIPVAVDGCGAPTFAVPLRALARAFARLVAAPSLVTGSAGLTAAAARVAAAMRAYPEMVSGDGTLDTVLMRAVPGLVAKIGADGVHAMGWAGPSGPMGIALKIMDGDSGRARTAVVLEILRRFGALNGGPALPADFTSFMTVRSLMGLPVGVVRPVFRLRDGGHPRE